MVGRWFAATRLGTVALAASVVASSCSSSGHPSAGVSGATPRGAAYSVLVEGTFSGPLVTNTAKSTPAVMAAFQGTPAHVIVCDNKGTPAGQLLCEHQAVADHAAAVIPTGAQVDESVLQPAGIPVVGIADATSSVSFEVSGAPALFVGMAVTLWQKGCRKLGFIGDQFAQVYQAQIQKAEPWESVTASFIPVAAADLSSAVAKLRDAGAQCVTEVTLPTQIVQLATALRQGNLDVPVVIPGPFVTPQLIQSLGANGNGTLVALATPDPSFGEPAIASVAAKIKAYDPTISLDQSDLYSFAFAEIVKDAVATIHGDVTAPTMLAALNKLRNAQTDGIYLPASMVVRKPVNDRRDFDTNVRTAVIRNGTLDQPSGWLNVGPELDRAVS